MPDTTACSRIYLFQLCLVLSPLGDIAVNFVVSTAAKKNIARSLTFTTAADTVSAGVKQLLRDLHSVNYPSMRNRCMDGGLLYENASALDKHRFRGHSDDLKFLKGTSKQNRHLVVPFSTWNLKLCCQKLAGDRMTLA